MPMMRAKMRVSSVARSRHPNSDQDILHLGAVGPKGAYPEGGVDEDNSFAMYTPCANLSMTINNPALIGRFHEGQTFYVDFTEVE
jgi:hypothetical protein